MVYAWSRGLESAHIQLWSKAYGEKYNNKRDFP